MKRGLAILLAIAAAACVAPAESQTAPADPVLRPQPPALPAPRFSPAVASRPQLPGPAGFVVAGELTQGGWLRGQAPGGTVSARLGEQALTLDPQGHFFAAFDRDAGPEAILRATLRDGRTDETPLTIAPRAWRIEHVNVARAPGGATAAFMRRREPELARIAAARQVETGSQGWRQAFIWPATGRLSGRFGSQRVYRGEPGSYHSGLDVAGATGTAYVAPADGVVVLAAQEEFSLEGRLLIIDHGQGLNSAFLHSSELLVREGEAVRQGQTIGRIGATGRATGPHLHWGLVWRGARLDPLLFTGPMP